MVACDGFHIEETQRVLADCVRVVFVTAGWSQLSFAAGTAQLEPGSIVTIPEGIWCAVTPNGFARTVTLYMHATFVRSHLQWLPVDHPLVHHLLLTGQSRTRPPDVIDIGERGIQMLRPKLSVLVALSRTTAGEFATLAYVAEVFETVASFAGSSSQTLPVNTAHPPRIPRRHVADATQALHHCLDRVWTVADLAREVAMSESQLNRLFRQDLGISPAAFLLNARTDRMAELLASSDMTVAETARAVGWGNPSVASRAFKRRYGLSPRLFATHAHLPGLLNSPSFEDHP